MPLPEPPRAAVALPKVFDRYQEPIQAGLREFLSCHVSPLYTTLKYYLGWEDPQGNPDPQPRGKALRPTLCLLACESLGGNVDRALPAAVALEYIHNFSLIHDDIQDGDETRHHRKTVWAVWGIPIGIASGNTIFSLADLTADALAERGVSAATSVAVGGALATRYLRMMEGQFLDISFEQRAGIDVDDYLDMIQRKTGALIECAVITGALIALDRVEDHGTLKAMQTLGRELGYVFQIRDDVLGVWGGPATGKPVGADIRRRKKALPAVHALSTAEGSAAEELARIYGADSPTTADVERVLEIMDALGTKDHCDALASSHWRKASNVLQSLPLSRQAASDLLELGEFLLIRDS